MHNQIIHGQNNILKNIIGWKEKDGWTMENKELLQKKTKNPRRNYRRKIHKIQRVQKSNLLLYYSNAKRETHQRQQEKKSAIIKSIYLI